MKPIKISLSINHLFCYYGVIIFKYGNIGLIFTKIETFLNSRQPEWLDLFQEYGNAFFVALFTLEMLVKMYSLGLQVSNLYIVMYLSSFILF